MRPIRVGVVGAGPMGRLHARTLVRLAETEKICVLHAVVDHHEGRAESTSDYAGNVVVTGQTFIKEGIVRPE